MDEFFEGKLYSGDFKGLMPKYYPQQYKQYIEEETALLKQNVAGAQRILEAGVGTGRLIPVLAPLVEEFIGIDKAEFMLDAATKVAKAFPNVRICSGDVETLSKQFPESNFEYSLCIWNTLGNLENQLTALEELRKVTKRSIFVTVFYKGTTKERLELYKAIDVTVVKIDEDETFHLKGYTSRTFSKDDMISLAQSASLRVKETKVLGGVILWAELLPLEQKKK